MSKKNSANSYARTRKLKKIGIITASVAAGVVAVISLIAFLPRSNEGFTVVIDNPEKISNFVMKEDNNGVSTTHLSGTPLATSYQTHAEKVETYINGFDTDTLHGSQNYIEETVDGKGQPYSKQLALVYTCYLENNSTSQTQSYGYYVNLDASKMTRGEVSPLSYLRLMVQTSIIEGDKSLEHEKKTTYYAYHAEKNTGTLASADDDRECISDFTLTANDDGVTVRDPIFKSNTDGYCVNFNVGQERIVSEDNLEIPAGKTLRFTFVAYLEGNDPESFTDGDVTAQLLMSLHFGI